MHLSIAVKGSFLIRAFASDVASNRMSQVTTGTGTDSVGYSYDNRDLLSPPVVGPRDGPTDDLYVTVERNNAAAKTISKK